MDLTWSGLLFVILAAAIAWFWRDSLRVRDAANVAAMEACNRLGLQFLDGTAAFTRLRLTRDRGRLILRRTYVFDYTAHSIDRLQGFVVLIDTQIESVGFARGAHHATAIASPHSNSLSNSPSDSPVNLLGSEAITAADEKVLDLDAWRRARETRH